ncbi:hypothetical protein GKG47_08845 [Lactonifactor sp. BIOML-A3]|uniref:hypothetical protein n=1 Tax=unclassified Lactonifactor TaxID=2636670 RepID=UPI0012AFBC6B|nr:MULTISPECIES: hypothetical protein [unclassified Lactonifactor]MSA02147.1 hypothetical protein [Lactonifactor sp. BIOML-A5]MSA07932.1 hypothetical protein [Lactonifactor sp. BIOML-A4]MSA12548.1 hypothetical protein [Lactonifactor sp. BIOML-A3]MSA16751.1 hypothetical protein [Lactonifactor sp. BIOML-A2]MSA37550.1 hypothetical protein [Lactonifactor sp. BIOML-A1]
MRYIKKQVFDSLEEVKEAFGDNGIIPITEMKQVIFYISRYLIQPVWICPSETNHGKMAYYFIKAETKKPYEEWMKSRPVKNTKKY